MVPSPRPIGMRIPRPYDTEDDFIRGDGLAIGRLGMILIGAPARPPGITVRFEIVLNNGEAIFRGEGRVVAHRVHANGRQGLEVRFTRLDSRSKGLVENVLKLRRAGALTPVSGDQADLAPSDDGPSSLRLTAPRPVVPAPEPPAAAAESSPPQSTPPPSGRPRPRRFRPAPRPHPPVGPASSQPLPGPSATPGPAAARQVTAAVAPPPPPVPECPTEENERFGDDILEIEPESVREPTASQAAIEDEPASAPSPLSPASDRPPAVQSFHDPSRVSVGDFADLPLGDETAVFGQEPMALAPAVSLDGIEHQGAPELAAELVAELEPTAATELSTAGAPESEPSPAPGAYPRPKTRRVPAQPTSQAPEVAAVLAKLRERSTHFERSQGTREALERLRERLKSA